MKPEVKIPMPTPANRRSFLLGATLAGEGAFAAVVAGCPGTKIVETLSDDSKPLKPKGYHVTPHISQYYETTKL